MATKKTPAAQPDSLAELEALIQQEAVAYIKDARNHIRKNLESATLSLLGLGRDYQGRSEIDHCNGRNSVLIDAFRKVAIEEATKIATNYRPDASEICGYADSFRAEFRKHIKDAITTAARAHAKAEAEAIVATIKVSVDDVLSGQ